MRRFIPTCVGTVFFEMRHAVLVKVHPHVCGDSAINHAVIRSKFNSSPRVWGQCTIVMLWIVNGRFIPTCVGTVIKTAATSKIHSVHPHVCGDSATATIRSSNFKGSSPRVWGQFFANSVGFSNSRFIPTCVGTVVYIASNPRSTKVHPHVCGDSRLLSISLHSSFGSSPRVWGQLLARLIRRIGLRFIPTCVGTVFLFSEITVAKKVHPHVCGDSKTQSNKSILLLGSSPRVWGQSWRGQRSIQFHRFIPTCVGTVSVFTGKSKGGKVHPHVCGDS